MWMLVVVILDIGPVASPPVTLQQPFASKAACGNARMILKRIPQEFVGYGVTMGARERRRTKGLVSSRWSNAPRISLELDRRAVALAAIVQRNMRKKARRECLAFRWPFKIS